jgi:beta-galactosidase/beta-glucuronidase
MNVVIHPQELVVIQNRSEVYLNGKLLDKRPNGYVSFLYDMTPFISFDKENELTVRVDHSQYADSRWYAGSGIYRNVWLVYAKQKATATILSPWLCDL